ncbi:TPR repeat protein [Salsuginibacillus halophilus]|uniref:TPR repeat protein n=1 Tax=Salsuginibacillus halophilus TaxID=517424 RepID=A0A2P8HX36_9BACI|nr:tetratricopeptide repeat protein [Salsuginibacillus halophilus]PSL50803.1 TPR repeat protein [Salsuginibacillus halophilus]
MASEGEKRESAYQTGVRCMQQQDPHLAVEWFQTAAEYGDARAMRALGRIYETGHGVDPDTALMKSWYEKAAEAGSLEAMCELANHLYEGVLIEREVKPALYWYERAAMGGVKDAAFMLGSLYYEGKDVTKAPKKAERWWKEAAQLGHTRALNNLAWLYAQKEGGAAKAYAYYEEAARLNDADAQVNLGHMLFTGKDVGQDIYEALHWWQKAAEQGHPLAKKNVKKAKRKRRLERILRPFQKKR